MLSLSATVSERKIPRQHEHVSRFVTGTAPDPCPGAITAVWRSQSKSRCPARSASSSNFEAAVVVRDVGPQGLGQADRVGIRLQDVRLAEREPGWPGPCNGAENLNGDD